MKGRGGRKKCTKWGRKKKEHIICNVNQSSVTVGTESLRNISRKLEQTGVNAVVVVVRQKKKQERQRKEKRKKKKRKKKKKTVASRLKKTLQRVQNHSQNLTD